VNGSSGTARPSPHQVENVGAALGVHLHKDGFNGALVLGQRQNRSTVAERVGTGRGSDGAAILFAGAAWASAAGSAGVRPRRLMCTHGRRRHTPPAAVRQITDSCRRSRCPRHWRGRARRARTSARQVLPTPQGADVAFVQFEDNWRPRHARRANRGGGAVCGRRRAEAFVAAFAATGQRGRAEAEAKPMFKALRAVTPRLQRLRRVHATQETLPRGNVTRATLLRVHSHPSSSFASLHTS